MELTTDQIEHYHERGYLVVRDALDTDLLARVRDEMRAYTHGDRDPEEFSMQLEPAVEAGEVEVDHPGDAVRKFEGPGMVRESSVFEELAFHDALVDPTRQLVSPNLKLLRCAAMLKPPEVGSEKSYHQDAAYYPIRPHDHLTTWIPLDEATPENGCMTVVPGAHTDGLMDHYKRDYETDLVLDAPYDEADEVELPMEPGDVLFGHCLLPHYTTENTTDSWRRAFLTAYMRSRSVSAGGDPWPYYHVAGEEFPGCV